tara:strand:+ start:357 stop:1472 length:1116 start_codon:yes stop_codon:yes gene_type:complete
MYFNKNDKIIIIFYIVLAISFISILLYTSTTYEDLPTPTWVLEQLTFVEIERTLEIEQERLFLTMSDIENYPKVLPQNFVSVKILEINENFIIAEEEIQEKGIRTKFLVKHTLIPYDEHILEIMDGDAKGTKIHQFFSTDGNFTKLITTVNIDFKGILTPFSYLPESNLNHAMNTVVTNFYIYAKGYDNPNYQIIDDLYREILLRPADKSALERYGGLLDENQITITDIRYTLLNSEEGKKILNPAELKQINELREETIMKIDDIYREILQRPYDEQGMKYYGTLLELEKLSIEDLEKKLFNSEEALNLRLNTPLNQMIDDVYMEVTGNHADWDVLLYYNSFHYNKTISGSAMDVFREDIKVDMLENLIIP